MIVNASGRAPQQMISVYGEHVLPELHPIMR